jgi:hypothetical protein
VWYCGPCRVLWRLWSHRASIAGSARPRGNLVMEDEEEELRKLMVALVDRAGPIRKRPQLRLGRRRRRAVLFRLPPLRFTSTVRQRASARNPTRL